MKCDNLFIDSCPDFILFFSQCYPFLPFTLVGPVSVPNMLIYVEHWVVDWCMFYRLSVTKCLCVQCLCPSDALFLCERDCDFCLSNVACFVLSASPFQWSWHCYGAHCCIVLLAIFFPLLDLEYCSTTKPLCMWSSVQKRLHYLSADSWSLES